MDKLCFQGCSQVAGQVRGWKEEEGRSLKPLTQARGKALLKTVSMLPVKCVACACNSVFLQHYSWLKCLNSRKWHSPFHTGSLLNFPLFDTDPWLHKHIWKWCSQHLVLRTTSVTVRKKGVFLYCTGKKNQLRKNGMLVEFPDFQTVFDTILMVVLWVWLYFSSSEQHVSITVIQCYEKS